MSDFRLPISDQQKSAAVIVLQIAVYLLLSGLTGWMLCTLLLTESPLALPMLLVFMALLFLSLNRWTGVLLLIVMQLDLLFREPVRTGFSNPLTAVLFVLVVLALLMFVSRYHALRQLPHDSLMRLCRRFLLRKAAENSQSDRQSELPGALTGLLMLKLAAAVIRSLVWLLLIVAGSHLLSGYVPTARDPATWTGTTATGELELWPGWFVLCLFIGLWVIISEFSWRQMTPRQADMYVRSIFLRLHYRDIRLIVLRRLKLRRMKAHAERRPKVLSASAAVAE